MHGVMSGHVKKSVSLLSPLWEMLGRAFSMVCCTFHEVPSNSFESTFIFLLVEETNQMIHRDRITTMFKLLKGWPSNLTEHSLNL